MAAHPDQRTGESILGSDDTLPQLAQDLAKRRRRADRLWRRYQAIDDTRGPGASTAVHLAWSTAVDDALAIAETVSRQRARDVDELALQFDAIWWWIVEDDSVMDSATRRWLRRFRWSLRRLADAD